MTVHDFITETADRFRAGPAPHAVRETAREVRMGIQRRLADRMGAPIWERGDWDILVVLDACRADLYAEVAPEYGRLPDEHTTVWSNASCSIDWILKNFNERPGRAASAGYVTGNPFADHDGEDARSADLGDADLAHFAPLYKTEWQPIDGGPVETIPPDVVTEGAIDAWRRRDELGMDRMVVHYMQPHQPYRSKPEWSSVSKNLLNLVQTEKRGGACAWQRARHGEIDTDELWDACRDNLRWVLDDVTERLLENVDGRVVLTADHGNAMGEFGEWAHPPGAIGPAVRRVPWVSVEATDERTVTPDERGGTDYEAATDDQLKALGYR